MLYVYVCVYEAYLWHVHVRARMHDACMHSLRVASQGNPTGANAMLLVPVQYPTKPRARTTHLRVAGAVLGQLGRGLLDDLREASCELGLGLGLGFGGSGLLDDLREASDPNPNPN